MNHAGQGSSNKLPELLIALGLGGGNANFTAEYQAILTYATLQGYVKPSPANQAAQNAFLAGLISEGIWDNLDVLYNFLTDGSADFAKINWKAPGTFQAIGTGHEPTFVANTGFKGDGIAQYLNTQFIPSAAGKMTADSATVFIESTLANQAAAVSALTGVSQGGVIVVQPNLIATNQTGIYVFPGVGAKWTTTESDGFWHGDRPNPFEAFATRNAVSFGYDNGVGGTRPTTPIFILSINSAGVPASFSANNVTVFGAGRSINGKQTPLYNAWISYKSMVMALADYQKVLDYATLQGFVKPSTAQQSDHVILIADLVRAGIWSQLDVFYNFLVNGDSGFAKINWKNPGTFQAVGTGHDPQFNTNDGFRGNGTTSYLDSTFIPSANAVKYTLNSGSLTADMDGADLPATTIEPEYQAILLYATAKGYTLPSPQQQLDQRQLIRSLKTAGVWDLLDVFYNFITDGSSDFAKINWKAPGTYQAVGTGHEPALVSNEGFKGTANGQYLDTGWIPINAFIYKANNASVIWDLPDIPAASSGNQAFGTIGLSNIGRISTYHNFNGVNAFFSINTDAGQTITITPVSGLRIASLYNAGANVAVNLNGSTEATDVHGAPSLSGFSVYLLNLNAAGAIGSGTYLNTMSCWGAGASMSGKEAAFYDAWKAYAYPYRATAAYKKITDYATANLYVLPSASQQTAQRQLILDLMNQGIWDKLDVFYNFATDGDKNFAKINWKNPATNYLVIIPSYFEPIFTPNEGFKSTVSGLEIFNTGLILSTAANYKASDASVFFDLIQVPTTGSFTTAVYDGIGYTQIQHTNAYINTSPAIPVTPVPQFLHTQILGSVAKVISDGVAGASVSQPGPTVPATYPIWMFARNNNNVPDGFVDATLSVYGIGASLGGKEVALYTAWRNYANPEKATGAYKRITDYATSQAWALPSAGQQAAQRQLILDLMNANIWNRLDVFYNFLTDAGVGFFYLINWKNPGFNNCQGGLAFLPNVGTTNSSTTLYALNDAVAYRNYKLNSASVIIDVDGDIATSNTIQLHATGPASEVIIYGNNFQVDINQTVRTAAPLPNPNRNIIQLQANVTDQKLFSNGVLLLGGMPAPSGLPNIVLNIGKLNGGGFEATNNRRLIAIGDSLSGKELAFCNAWNAYRASVAYKIITDYATTQGFTLPSASQQTAQRNLITAMMKDGTWDQLDVFYNFYTNGDANFAKINWKAPGTFQATSIGAPVFAANAGFKMNGADGLDTHFVYSTDAKKFKLNDCSVGLDYLDPFNPLDFDVLLDGVSQTVSQVLFYPYNSSNLPDIRVCVTPGGYNVALAPNPGLWQATRHFAGAGIYLSINGSAWVQGTNTVSSLPTFSHYIGCLNNAGAGAVAFGHQRYGCFFIGANLFGPGNGSPFNNAWTTYKANA